MRLSISNIAWDPAQDEDVCQLLHKHSIDAIDIAPGKYFSEPDKASDRDIKVVREYWESRGISLVGMQSLLFGTQGLNVFSERSVQDKMLSHLTAISHIAAGLGITSLVFGSPKNRDRFELSDEKTLSIAHDFFSRLGAIALQEGVIICLEPNPECYGANFMTNSKETADVVKLINHPAIMMQLDTGAIAINQENIEQVIKDNPSIIGHIHLSEPGLIPLGRGGVEHFKMAKELKKLFPNKIATIEMLMTHDEPSLMAIDEAISFATHHYQSVSGVSE